MVDYSEMIQIIGLEIAQGELSKLILNGNFKFNINDEIWVVNDNNPTPYSLVGDEKFSCHFQ